MEMAVLLYLLGVLSGDVKGCEGMEYHKFWTHENALERVRPWSQLEPSSGSCDQKLIILTVFNYQPIVYCGFVCHFAISKNMGILFLPMCTLSIWAVWIVYLAFQLLLFSVHVLQSNTLYFEECIWASFGGINCFLQVNKCWNCEVKWPARCFTSLAGGLKCNALLLQCDMLPAASHCTL